MYDVSHRRRIVVGRIQLYDFHSLHNRYKTSHKHINIRIRPPIPRIVCQMSSLCVVHQTIRAQKKKTKTFQEMGEAVGIYNKNMRNSFRQHLITGARLFTSKCDRFSFVAFSSSSVVTYFSLFAFSISFPFVFALGCHFSFPFIYSVARGDDIFPSGREFRWCFLRGNSAMLFCLANNLLQSH